MEPLFNDPPDYDPNDRLEPCPDDDAHDGIRGVELTFAIPVSITTEQYRRLCDLMDEITCAPWNTPKNGLHWFAGQGSKPHFSQADAAFLGIPAEPGAPESGEPTFDDSVIALDSAARGFVSGKERQRTLNRRARKAGG